MEKRILCVGQPPPAFAGAAPPAEPAVQLVAASHPVEALKRLYGETFEGVYVSSEFFRKALPLGKLLQNVQILDALADGVLLLDSELNILWANQRVRQWSKVPKLEGVNFYTALGNPEILGPDYSPFATALATGQPSSCRLRSEENRYFQVHAALLPESQPSSPYLLVTLRDVTEEVLQDQKLHALHQAGMELADLKPEELTQMSVEERIELLKANILHYTKDVLHYDVVEIRLLDPKTGELRPLLAEGMDPEAAQRVLYAQPQGNGVTGFVAATGKSYLCDNTAEDPLYLPGVKGARSSMTVPLIFGDKVIGTFNVESPKAHAFSESDLQFMEIFTRQIAAALNTLELLVAEKASGLEAVHGAIALPMDEILNDAVYLREHCTDQPSEILECICRILRNARDIKQLIYQVGEQMAPAEAHPLPLPTPEYPLLKGRKVLVVDADKNARSHAHRLLDRLGCIVDTAIDGKSGLCLVRTMLSDGGYDVILADDRLPDMNGYQFMMELRELLGDPVPLILMIPILTYDEDHSIIHARQAGLKAVVFKPVDLEKLLPAVERIVSLRTAVVSASP
ncbi:MAG: GAF domain-containing protein [Thermoguttaceae bacterium]|nr:GAF domain-containing protein [Thermoguttaceae bacterium]MDW8038634.1 GAF domain-containing protein [Thermoguttaceae bacterium]